MTFIVTITHEWDPYDGRTEEFRFEEVEQAAQKYESEAITENQPLAQIVEELAWEGLRLDSFDPETGKRVVAYELKPAGVV